MARVEVDYDLCESNALCEAVAPDVFEVLLSVKPVVMVLLGGAGTVLGPVLGAAIYLALEEVVWRNFLTVHAGILGLLIVALIFLLPGGVLGLDLARARRRVGLG